MDRKIFLNWYEIDWTDRDAGKYKIDGVEVVAVPRIERIPIKGKEEFCRYSPVYSLWAALIECSRW